MSSWGNYDAASNVPYWSAASVKLEPTAANAADLYEDTTANNFITGATVGVYAVDDPETMAEGSKAAHAGWVLRTTGSGGRAGRVQEETLAVISKFKSDNNSDDAVYPDATITLVQPTVFQRVTVGGGNTATFSVAGTRVVPGNATVTYQWQVNNNAGGTWVNVATQPGGATWTGNTAATMVFTPSATTANNYVFRCIVTATNAGITNSSATATTANARIELY